MSVTLNTQRWKLVSNSPTTSCVCISISLEMDPDLISGPDGKQREVMDYFHSPKNTLGQPYWNKVKKYILNPPRTYLLSISEANMIGLSS